MAEKTQNYQPQKVSRGPGMGRQHGMPIESAKNFKQAFTSLIRYMGPQLGLVILASVFVLLSVILQVLAPAMIGNAIRDHIETAPDIEKFLAALVVILVVFIATWITGALSNAIMTRISTSLVYRLRNETFEHLQKLSMSYIDKRGIGDIMSRLTNDIEMISNVFNNGFINLINGFFALIGILAAMIILNFQLTLIVLAMVPLMTIVTGVIGKKVRNAYRDNQKFVGKLNANIAESVSGVKVIKTLNREDEEFKGFEKVNAGSRDAGIKAEVSALLLMPVMQFITSFILMLMVGIGGALVLYYRDVFSIGLLTSFIIYSQRFFEPLRQMSQVYNILQSGMAGAERVFEVLAAKPEVAAKEGAVTIPRARGNIEFKNLTFGYDKDTEVLKNINLNVKEGEVIAIVGPTGAGKTTLVNLLSRFYDVNEGAIILDGRDIRDIEPASLRKQMGVVLQEPFFFALSIKENLRYGNPDATDEQLIEAAKLANADDFIRRLPNGYDTVLSEKGMNLSQGERQLLAIARVVAADPAILVLDEATSNIDSLTENHIQKGLLTLMKGRTSFIIAHRLSTIKNANKVIVIHNKEIIEEGTHRELMEKKGFYSRLYAMQQTKADVTEDMTI